MNRVLVVVLVAVGLLLNGCAQFPTPGELIKPPVVKMEAASAEAAYSPAELKQIVMPFLPPGATLLADQQTDDKTSGGKSRETIRVADLNGDGVTEIIAGYRISQGSVGVMVLQQREKWEKVWQEEGKGYNLERLQLADITGDGRDELLIGWTIGASAGDGLDIMSWQGDGLKRIATSGYHRLEVEDLAGEFGQDGKQELAVWVRDTGDAFWVNVLRWDGQKLAEAEDTYSAYFPRVVEYYRQRIKEGGPLSPRFYWYYLADALVKVKDYQGALEAVEKGAALDNNGSPPDAQFLPVRGRALLGLQRYQEALTVYQSLVGEITGVKLLQPDRFSSRDEVTRDTFPARLPNPVMRMLGEAYWGMGEAYLGLGQREEAVASLQKAVDLVPDRDKPRNALDRLTLQQVAERIHGYWANTKPEEFSAKLKNFGDWAQKQALPGGEKLFLNYTPVEGNYPPGTGPVLLVDWALEGGPFSGIQAHGIYWIQNNHLKSQVLYSVDAFNHGLDQSRAAIKARVAQKVDAQGNKFTELGVVYDGAHGGSGSPQPVFYLWRLVGDRWQVVWRSDESHQWRNSHGKLNFAGPGLEEFTLEGDSWLVNDGRDNIFKESNPGPHRHFLDTWQRKGDGFECMEARTLPSAYNTLVELVYNLSLGREKEAGKLVTEPGLLEQARKYGLVQKPPGQGWLLELPDPWAEQSGPLTVVSGSAQGVTVEFVQRDGQWLASKIYRKEKS